jgi:hypothetical protein
MTTPYYKWPLPQGTDLVISGDDAIRALGNGVDASMAPHECEGSAASAGSIPPTAWTKVSITQQDYKVGTAVGVAGNGITVSVAGRYLIIGSLNFSNAVTTGRRLVSWGSFAATTPAASADAVGSTGTSSSQCIQVVQTANLPAGYVVCLFGYQDSGQTLQLPGRRLIVRRLNP